MPDADSKAPLEDSFLRLDPKHPVGMSGEMISMPNTDSRILRMLEEMCLAYVEQPYDEVDLSVFSGNADTQ